MNVCSTTGLKVFNATSGRAYPQWLGERQRRRLAKNEAFRRRIDLFQDFEFSTAVQIVKMSPDKQYIVATGIYPPRVRTFDVHNLAMKFERGLDSEVVDFEILSEDYAKLAFLHNNRILSFHSGAGFHHSLRIPKFGRSLAYHPQLCDLFIAASATELYRLSLEEGRFRIPLETSFDGASSLSLSKSHSLLAVGSEGNTIDFFDSRASNSAVSSLQLDLYLSHLGEGVSVVSFEQENGLLFSAGTTCGSVFVYDIRSSTPLAKRQHQYGLPIVSIQYLKANSNTVLLSADKKLIKLWDVNQPDDTLCNIETNAAINSVCLVSDPRSSQFMTTRKNGDNDGNTSGQTGLILAATEQRRIQAYFIPYLGSAPSWCSYLDSLANDEDEAKFIATISSQQADAAIGSGQPVPGDVYDDYKFLTEGDLESLGAKNLIGTQFLKGYMHGFFMKTELYIRLKAVMKPFEYDEYKKGKTRERIEKKRSSRIIQTKTRKTAEVNQDYANRLMTSKQKGGDADGQVEDNNPIGDNRFKDLFFRQEFEINKDSDEYKSRHTSMNKGYKSKGPMYDDAFKQSDGARGKRIERKVLPASGAPMLLSSFDDEHFGVSKQNGIALNQDLMGNDDDDGFGKTKRRRRDDDQHSVPQFTDSKPKKPFENKRKTHKPVADVDHQADVSMGQQVAMLHPKKSRREKRDLRRITIIFD